MVLNGEYQTGLYHLTIYALDVAKKIVKETGGIKKEPIAKGEKAQQNKSILV